MPNLHSFSPPIIRLWPNVLQGLILDENITLIHKYVVIFYSIIMVKLVICFTFQAETECLYREGQFMIFLPNSLLPSFALRRILIVDPLDLVYNIFITGIFCVLSWITTGAYISYTKSLCKRKKSVAHSHMIYVTVNFFLQIQASRFA